MAYGTMSIGNAGFTKKFISALFLLMHPVGTPYASENPTSPAELYGGTWEQIKDSFILAAGDTYAAGSKGGEANHTLANNEMPSHTHIVTAYYNYGWNIKVGLELGEMLTSPNHINITGSQSIGTDIGRGYLGTNDSGGGQPHNNMPPYYSMYIWRRVA